MSADRSKSIWTIRLLAVVLGVNIVALGVIAAAVASLFPLKEVRPFAVNFADRSEVVATIAPITQQAGGFDELARGLAREYVIMRHSVVASPKEMERRWNDHGSIIFLESTPAVYNQFIKEAIAVTNAVQAIGATVSVDVKSVSTIEPGRTYQVEFVMESRDKAGKLMLAKAFVSTLTVQFDAVATQTQTRLTNPTGFTVVSYSNVEKTS
jgi:type IV secretory pathway component VirB8